MLTVSQRIEPGPTAQARLVLTFEQRSRSRFRAQLDSGEEIGLQLARGLTLRSGELLLAADGRVIEVVAARESVSTAHSADTALLMRAAYHLGNRHVALQIGSDWLRYAHDPVLDDMVRGLGLRVAVESAPFEPESGAYPRHEHSHGGHAHGG
jgi:urease accessory protein